MNIDAKLIKDLVQKSEKYNYDSDEKGYINDKGLIRFISESVESIYKSSLDTLPELLDKRDAFSNNRINSEIEISKGLFFSTLLHAIFNFLVDGKYYENEYERCSYLLMHHLFNIYQSILDLMVTDHNLSCLIHSRILYETYTILAYILKNPSLSEPYLDHSIYVNDKIQKMNSNKEPLEESSDYRRIREKYPDDFFHDYGWTYSIIKDKRSRKLSTLAYEVDLKEYSTFYRVASEATHSSSLFINANHEKINIVSYFYINAVAIELVSNGLMKIMKAWKVNDEHLIFLRNIIYAFREELFDEPIGYGENEA